MQHYFLDIVGNGRIFADRLGESHDGEREARDAAAALVREIGREFGARHGYAIELLDEKRRLIARIS
ncbi:MAG TPA: hypothetical protein VGC36_14780 [Rhizomicrobium sp.]